MKRKREFFLLTFDIISIIMSYYIAAVLKYGGIIPKELMQINIVSIIIVIIIKVFIFSIFNLYTSIWRYASIDELLKITVSVLLANVIVIGFGAVNNTCVPFSVFIVATLLDLILIGGIRFIVRAFTKIKTDKKSSDSSNKILIIGAGAAGVLMLKEIRTNDSINMTPVGFIDDDEDKQKKQVNGIPVLGNRHDIIRVCKEMKVDTIVLALPSASGKEIKNILNIAKQSNCKIKTLPSITSLISGKDITAEIRDVKIEDLLGREEINLDLRELSKFITGKRILVTGGGGSIGSELCRQIAAYNPESLVIVDIYENNAYDIQNELLDNYKYLNLKVYIASVRDKKRLDSIFKTEEPHIVFHAAAHKHVPLMEFNPQAAIKNNVFGTLNTVQVAGDNNVDKFVLISTDKAVNPTNVMGATKRICERIVQTYNKKYETDYVSVRFGNVLGSNGSVIPIFKRQIEAGGPVTVTHREITRFFMTIPEACQLVLEAGSMASGGEIFVLDMGEPVKIVDLATDLIKLSGYEPEKDIKIKITGLRPGEKLYEEILIDTEKMLKTENDKIFIEKPMDFSCVELLEDIKTLEEVVKDNNEYEIIDTLKKIVPTYNPTQITE